MNTTSPKNFLKALQLNANGILNKTYKIQLLKNAQADVIIIQETKLNQSHKTPNIPQLIPIRTDSIHKQGGGLLTYMKNNINFSQLNTSNTFPIELQIIKIHLSALQQLCNANMYIPPKHSTQLSQTEKDSIISNMFTTEQIFKTQSSQQMSTLTHHYGIH